MPGHPGPYFDVVQVVLVASALLADAVAWAMLVVVVLPAVEKAAERSGPRAAKAVELA